MENVHEPAGMLEVKKGLVKIAAPYIPKLQEMDPDEAARRMEMPEVMAWDFGGLAKVLTKDMDLPEPTGLWVAMAQCRIKSEDGSRVELILNLNLQPYSPGQRDTALDTDLRQFAYDRRMENRTPDNAPKRYSIWFVADAPPEECTEDPLHFAIDAMNMGLRTPTKRVEESYNILFLYFDEDESQEEGGTIQEILHLFQLSIAISRYQT